MIQLICCGLEHMILLYIVHNTITFKFKFMVGFSYSEVLGSN